jgi:hypothetical protein
VHSGPFGCLTKLDAKRVVLVQKFVPRSRVRIFLYEHTRSTELDRKLTFWCILYSLGAFGTVWLPYETRSKTVRTSAKFVPRSRIGIFRKERTRSTLWTLNCRFVALYTIWVHSGQFGCLTKLDAKWAVLVQKFVPRSRIRIFRNEHTRSTPLDPKLMFCCVSYYLGAFGTVWVPYETHCKTGRTCAKVRATKSRPNFSQRTHPINLIGP